jgi:hypothetical protein
LKAFTWLLLTAAAQLASAQFAGPALLTRGEAPGAASAPTIEFQPFIEVGAIYSNGLAGVILSDSGELANSASGGVRLAFGISGRHRWRRTDVGLNYRGSMSHYFRQTFYDSVDHSLLLGVKHTVSRHIDLQLSQSAGMFSRDFGLLGIPQTALFDPSRAYTPTTDYFDNRTFYLSSAATLVVQKTSRLSFSLGGVGMLNRRRSQALRGVNGVSASGDVQYRASRRSTIGGNYQYQRFSYTNFIGTADVHGLSFTYATALSPRVEFSGYGGASHTEIKSLTTTPTDPVIAALLGVTESMQIVHYLSWTPTFGARIARRIPQGMLHLSAGRSINPGNGLFGTSATLNVGGGYAYTGLRRWSASVQASYSYAEALAGLAGNYNSLSAGVRLSRKLISALHLMGNYSLRQYASPTFARYRRVVNEVNVGIGFTPGEIPLRIW